MRERRLQLSKIQDGFRALMLNHPRALENPPAEFAGLFAEGDIPLSERLKVYRNNIVGNLTEVMLNHYPLIRKLVGDDFLKMMARTYILANPPRHGYLDEYGIDFDQFIAGFEPAKALPYLADVARFEWAMNKAYNAADDTALLPQDLAGVAPDALGDLGLRLRASATLLASAYPLDQIRDFCLRDEAAGTLDITQGSVRVMVYRPGLEVIFVTLAEDEMALLQRLSDKTLGESVALTLAEHTGLDVQGFLQRHLALGTFAAGVMGS